MPWDWRLFDVLRANIYLGLAHKQPKSLPMCLALVTDISGIFVGSLLRDPLSNSLEQI